MTLYVWVDADGKFRVSHFPPIDANSLMVAMTEGSSAYFLDMLTLHPVEIEAKR